MVPGHAPEDVVEYDDGGVDVGSFVEHDAFGALAHGRVGDFGTRRLARACEVVEDLGRPDDGDVGRFAEPQDFFLDFGEAFVAGFDREIAPGDHDADERGAHGVQEDLGQPSERGGGLDLQDEPEVLAVNPSQVRMHGVDVVFVA